MKKILVMATAVLLLAACNETKTEDPKLASETSDAKTDSQEAKEERNKQTALASIKGFDEHNVDMVLKDADKDAVDYGEGSMAPVKGVDSVKAGLGAWMKAVPDYKGSDLIAVADGDYVMVYGTWTGTWKNDFMGMKATGKSFKVSDVDIFKFNDAGKIIEHRGVQSNATVARQIGMPMQGQ